jgi:phage terminase small subunit
MTLPENTDDGLTTKQVAFIEHYLGDCKFNATRAAIAAGYSERSAYAMGHQTLQAPAVRRAIDVRLSDLGASRERVLSELITIALGMDIADFELLLQGGNIEELRKSGVDTRMIRKIQTRREVDRSDDEPVTYDKVTLELLDRQRAVDQLIRVLGLDELEVTQRIAELRELLEKHKAREQRRKEES